MTAACILLWPDSELSGLTEAPPRTLRLRLSAAACRGVDEGPLGPATRYLRPLDLRFEGAGWCADGPLLGGIAHGSLLLDGQPLGSAAHRLPLPIDRRGRVACHLRLISGTELHIEAVRVVAEIPEAACFRESFAC